MDNSLKWPLFNIVSGQKTSTLKAGEVFIENLTVFLLPKSSRKYSHTNPNIFAKTTYFAG